MSHQPPSDITPPDAKQRLAPFRRQIDVLDARIIAFLGERFAVVRQVAALKAEHGIHPVLKDRIEEVVARARDAATKAGFDADVAEQVYRVLLDASCQLEDDYIASHPLPVGSG